MADNLSTASTEGQYTREALFLTIGRLTYIGDLLTNP